MDYFDFELEIAAASANAYPVTVIRSPAGEAHETLRLPFDDRALSAQLSALQQALAGSGQMGSQFLAPASADYDRALQLDSKYANVQKWRQEAYRLLREKL